MNEDKDKDCLGPENNSKYCFFKVANAFLLLANLLLIILGFYYLNSKEDNSYFSMIVSALTILVTVLLGWQIYKSVEFNRAIRKINATQRKLTDLEHIMRGGVEFAIGFPTIDSNPRHTLTQCMVALEHLNRATTADYDNIIRAMLLISTHEPFGIINKPRLLAALYNSHRPEADALIRTFNSWPDAPMPNNPD